MHFGNEIAKEPGENNSRFFCVGRLNAFALVDQFCVERLIGNTNVALQRHDLGINGIQDPAGLREERVLQFLEATTTGGASKSSNAISVT